jgi:hypothetical protein
VSSDVDSAIDTLQRSGALPRSGTPEDLTLYAFGHTAATEQVRRRLDRDGIRLSAVLDNNPLKQGGSLGGVPILAPEAVTDHCGPSLVLIASRFYDDMRRQLIDLGYAEERILRVADFSITTDTAAGADPDRGTRLLERLRRAHPGRHLVLCPFGAFGDVYWALAYLPAFAAAHQLRPLVPVVVGEGCREVARLFGFEDADSLTQVAMDDLVAAVVSAEASDATIAHHDRPYGSTAPVRVLDERFVAFIDMYRELVYGLSDRAEPQTPSRERVRRGNRRPVSDGLAPGRTVLLAPYAKSVLPVASSFWKDTAELYASQGYAVATVVHGAEDAVPGTVALEVEIEDLLEVAEHAGTFIALRSGLCDVVHAARARKVHVSPDAYYSTTRYKVADFFALPGWESVVLPVL